mmetsp:Transcript_56569/g.67788  ORF Transcript_56569/g.67788 Transcript_56569/m.67788 type:complete len:88 (+) Transcript_56569:120-383(+)
MVALLQPSKRTNNRNCNNSSRNNGGGTADQYFAEAEEEVIEDEVHADMNSIDGTINADIAADIEEFDFDQVDGESAQPHSAVTGNKN